MKKIIILLGIVFLLNQSAFSFDEQVYCAKEPYNTSKGIGSFLSSITGTNFLVTQVAQKEIAKSMKKDFGGQFKVKIDTFGGSNLQNGKFKKLTIKGKNLDKNGISVTEMQAETLCGFNHINYSKGKLSFKENMVIKYQSKITATDLKNIVNSSEYKKSIDNLSINAGKKVIFKVINSDINIQNNKVVMSYDLVIPFLMGTKIRHVAFSAGLSVDEGKIYFTNVKFGNSLSNMAVKSAVALVNLINPLSYNMLSEKNYNAIVNVKTVKIFNNEILTEGTVIIPKTKI